MEHFYVITNKTKDTDNEVTYYIRDYLEGKGKRCSIRTESDMMKAEQICKESIPRETDCVLVLGGDGTLLQAAVDLADAEIPFLGINMGTYGFLAEVERTGIDHALNRLIDDDYQIEKRMMISGVIEAGASVTALNDIVITGKAPMQIINFSVFVNGQLLNRYYADGIIIATPTGSTGYNLSAGGPIISPKAEMILITPICPHTLHSRSIVLAADDVITIDINGGRDAVPQEAEAIFDGSHRIPLKTGDKVTIGKSEKTTAIVKLNKVSFLDVLHRKMNG